MPIKFRCPSCEKAFAIATEKAGSKIKCPECGTKIRVPDARPKKKSSSSEPKSKDSKSSKKEPSKPSVTPKLEAALESLFDDDDDMFQEEPDATVGPNDGEVRLETDDDDASDVAEIKLEPADDDDDGATVRLETEQDDDDLDAVLEFENSLADDAGPDMSALPDELFGDEDEEDGLFSNDRGGDDEELDLTPMVDVTFLLLIFFMITASFTIQKTMQVPPPNPDEQGASMSPIVEDPEDESVRVDIDQRNMITIDDDPLPDIDQLVDFLRQTTKTEILITAHEDTLHEIVVKVLDAANEVEMQRIRLGITKN